MKIQTSIRVEDEFYQELPWKKNKDKAWDEL